MWTARNSKLVMKRKIKIGLKLFFKKIGEAKDAIDIVGQLAALKN